MVTPKLTEAEPVIQEPAAPVERSHRERVTHYGTAWVAGTMLGMLSGYVLTESATGERIEAFLNRHDQDQANIITSCEPVDQAALEKVTEALDHPRLATYIVDRATIPTAQGKHVQQAYAKQQLAEKYQVTILDPSQTLRPLQADLDRETARLPVSEYVAAVNEFTANYGVTISAPQTAAAGLDPGMQAIDLPSLDGTSKWQIRHALVDFARALSELPQELVTESGLRNIYLVSINNKHVAGRADMSDGSRFYIDPHRVSDGSTFIHELTHLWDAKVCGVQGAGLDPGFDSLNPTEIYRQHPFIDRDTDRGKAVALDEYQFGSRWQSLRQELREHPGTADALQARAALAAAQRHVAVTTRYAFKNELEDKATLGENLFTPSDYDATYNRKQPILAAKFAYLMARVYQTTPQVAKYLLAVGTSKAFSRYQ